MHHCIDQDSALGLAVIVTCVPPSWLESQEEEGVATPGGNRATEGGRGGGGEAVRLGTSWRDGQMDAPPMRDLVLSYGVESREGKGRGKNEDRRDREASGGRDGRRLKNQGHR